MLHLDIRTLISKLNSTTRTALEGATGLCVSRTHYDVELEHWLLKLLDRSDTDLAAILKHFGLDAGKLSKDLTRAIDAFKTGNTRTPALSPRIVEVAKEAWLLASLDLGETKLRSGHIVCALLNDSDLTYLAYGASKEFEKINAQTLRKSFTSLLANSHEGHQETSLQASDSKNAATTTSTTNGQTPALDQFTIDLTQRAKNGEIDPVLGRDHEVRAIIDVLTRRRQNNPILTGEAGVGKTAVVEGFALRIAQGDIPPLLKNVAIKSLDLGLLQAGASVRGEFENRLRNVISEVKSSPQPIIMFIDEAHTLIGAGGQAGQGDAANLLKPALARGELRTIAATTWTEYKKYFEKDPALTRRFQVVKVDEPSENIAIKMMRGLVEPLEKYHKIRVLDEAVIESVRLSHRYIPDRQMPDKCVSVLDTACARVAISQNAIPTPLENCQRQLQQLDVETQMLEREMLTGAKHNTKLEQIDQQRQEVTQALETLNQQWQQEQDLIAQSRQLRDTLEANVKQKHHDSTTSETERTQWQADLAELDQKLAQVQGENPLIHVCVDSHAIAQVIAGWTGIPVGRMVSDEIQSILKLQSKMNQRIIGQDHALKTIAKNIHTSRAKLTDPNKPNGIFLMAGPSGVGKTETALAVADLLYGGEQNLTVINMSEFKEEHKVSLLMGSPPGYVGYGEGGVLTEAVRRKPYSVILLDEMEKAHPGVQDIFYQVFDKGMMKDGEGRDIDFKNTVIIIASNLGSDTITKLCADPETMPNAEGISAAIQADLLSYFKPAFLGRVNIVPYYPLFDDTLQLIIRLKLQKIVKRVKENYDAELTYSDDLIHLITERCTEVHTGARNIDHILENSLLPRLSVEFLGRMADGNAFHQVSIHIQENSEISLKIS